VITLPDVLALVLLLSVAAYAAGAGTDYGAGFWDLFAGDVERGQPVRDLIEHAMEPVWEVNNVWLIFSAVVTWTAFPIVWQSIFESLYPLLAIGVLGLVLRGVGFSFRRLTHSVTGRRRASAIFGLSSILTPFCFAAALGSIASGRIGSPSPIVPLWEACINPTSVAFGLVGVSATAFTGAAFLLGDARRYGAPDLMLYFRRRAIGAGIVTVLLALGALVVMTFDASDSFHGLLTVRALPFAALGLLATIAVGVLLAARRYSFYRIITVVAIGSYVLAFGFGLYPYLLPGQLTISQAAGATSTLQWYLIVTIVALVLLIPSLGLLYWLDQHNDLEEDSE
jgi:cytochrome bd ubiquinol oxidase subunit II